jgi:hypothetical protein
VYLSRRAIRKIKVPKVLNWDSTGYPEKNIVNIVKDEERFNHLIEQNTHMLRIALHPRDPHSALEEQKRMIGRLKYLGYVMLGYVMPTYGDLMHKLRSVTSS